MSTPTVYDVAERAGVSIATVSRVYRTPGSVRAATRERVLEAARELGYLPSGSARGLASRTTGVLGLCFPDFPEFHDAEAEGGPDADDAEPMPYSDEVIRGMERAARRHGYALLICASPADRAGEALAEVAGRVDGLAVLAQQVPEEERDHLEAADFDGQLELTRHLLRRHRMRRLAFVGGPCDSPDGEARFRGFQAAHLEAGLLLPDRPDVRGDLTRTAGRKAVRELLDRDGERPEAVVFANDQMAVGALHALAERGVGVPDEIVVTGFGGIPLGRLVQPALTTVRQPMGRLGEEAVELLVARLRDRERPAEARVLPVQLQIRASCGCG